MTTNAIALRIKYKQFNIDTDDHYIKAVLAVGPDNDNLYHSGDFVFNPEYFDEFIRILKNGFKLSSQKSTLNIEEV